MSIRMIDGIVIDADTLDGEQPAAFEDAGVAAGLIGDHAGVGDAHHDKTSDAAEIVSGVFPPAQLGINKKYVISDELLHSHDAEVSLLGSQEWTLKKTITLNTLFPSPVTLRIKFDLRTDTELKLVHARIYKNGETHGADEDAESVSYQTYSADLEFEQGDTLELWLRSFTADITAFARNLRIYGIATQITLLEALTENKLGLADVFGAVNS
ncbi:hypothetical protein ES708_34635 [subsurface metagenome]